MRLTEVDRLAQDRADAPYLLVVTLGVGALERHYAAGPEVIRTAGGSSVQVDGGLLEAEVPTRTASVRDATINLAGDVTVRLAPDPGEWLALLRQRSPLQRMRVQLALVAPDLGTWEDRVVVHTGVVRTPTHDLRAGEVTLKVVQESTEGAGRVPDLATARLFPDLDPDVGPSTLARSVGEALPVLYGTSVLEVVPVAVHEATDDNRLVVARHHVDDSTTTVDVHAYDEVGEIAGSPTAFTPVNAADGAGRPYSYVSLTDLYYFKTGTQAHAFLVDAPGKRGTTPRGAATARELHLLGEVLLDLLYSYSELDPAAVDADSFLSFDAALPLEVSLQVSTEDLALGWARKIVEPFPASLAWVGGRLRLAPARLSPDSPPAVSARLEWDRELWDLLSPYEEESVDGVVNDLVVRYAYSNRLQKYGRTIELNPETSPEARESAYRYGRRAAGSAIDLWMVRDAATAHVVAREWLARAAHARTRASYAADARACAALEPLCLVEVVDQQQGSPEGSTWFVEELQPGDEGVTILKLASRYELGR